MTKIVLLKSEVTKLDLGGQVSCIYIVWRPQNHCSGEHDICKIQTMRSFFLLVFFTFKVKADTCLNFLTSTLSYTDLDSIVQEYQSHKIDYWREGRLYPAPLSNIKKGDTLILIMSPVYKVPYILHMKYSKDFWSNLSKTQKKYFLKLVRRIFQNRTYSRKHDDRYVLKRLLYKLGISLEEYEDLENNLTNEAFDEEFSNLPVWIPKWVRAIISFKRFLQKNTFFDKYSEYMSQKLKHFDDGESSDSLPGLSPQVLFSLSDRGNHCAGVCRHANDQMAAVLIEMGVPASDLRLRSGFPLLFIFVARG